MKEVYQATDGKIFDTRASAFSHEVDIYHKWLEETPHGRFCQEVLNTMDNLEENDYHCTDFDLGKTFAQAAHRLSLQNPESDDRLMEMLIRSVQW